MIKRIILILLIFILGSNCSFDTKSGIWTNDKKIQETVSNNKKIVKLFKEREISINEYNKDLLMKVPLNPNKYINAISSNNLGPQLIIDILKKKSKYKFSKIKYFNYFSPELVFEKNNLVFFDKKGNIIKFDDTSKVIWKKNYYSKEEKKLLPILNFSSNDDLLIVTDNLANYYALNIFTGEKKWKKNHKSIFISEIKIDKDKFYVVDSNNKLNCFSLIDGKKIWEFDTDYDLIKSQKKLSIVIDNKFVYFNNSRGDIYSLDKENGNLIWLTPTRKGSANLQSFLLKSSKLVLDQNNLFFSNNKNNFFSLDKNTGIIEWSQNINSDLKPVIAGNIIFAISLDGYLFVVEKMTGNIIRVTDIFKGTKYKNKKNLSISGFVVGYKKIYLSLDNGKILKINISNGKLSSILKISNGKISEPFINNGKMFIIKNDEIIKLN